MPEVNDDPTSEPLETNHPPVGKESDRDRSLLAHLMPSVPSRVADDKGGEFLRPIAVRSSVSCL